MPELRIYHGHELYPATAQLGMEQAVGKAPEQSALPWYVERVERSRRLERKESRKVWDEIVKKLREDQYGWLKRKVLLGIRRFFG